MPESGAWSVDQTVTWSQAWCSTTKSPPPPPPIACLCPLCPQKSLVSRVGWLMHIHYCWISSGTITYYHHNDIRACTRQTARRAKQNKQNPKHTRGLPPLSYVSHHDVVFLCETQGHRVRKGKTRSARGLHFANAGHFLVDRVTVGGWHCAAYVQLAQIWKSSVKCKFHNYVTADISFTHSIISTTLQVKK